MTTILAVFLTFSVCLPALAVTDQELDMASQREAYQAESRYGVVTDAALCARVQAVFLRVARASAPARCPVRLRILNNPQPNAFSLPDGTIYLDVGLFRLDPTDDELAFVLGHEIAHVCREHCKQVAASAERGGAFATNAYLNGYSRFNEMQADLDGVAAVEYAGYDPAAALVFLQKMSALDATNGQNPDHPVSGERMQNVTDLLRAHPEWRGSAPQPTVAVPGGYSPDPYAVRPWGR